MQHTPAAGTGAGASPFAAQQQQPQPQSYYPPTTSPPPSPPGNAAAAAGGAAASELTRRRSAEPKRAAARAPPPPPPPRLSFQTPAQPPPPPPPSLHSAGAFGSASPLLSEPVDVSSTSGAAAAVDLAAAAAAAAPSPSWRNAWEEEQQRLRRLEDAARMHSGEAQGIGTTEETLRSRSGVRPASFDDRAAGLGDRPWDRDGAGNGTGADVSGVLEPSPRRTSGRRSSAGGRPSSGGGLSVDGGGSGSGWVQRMIRTASGGRVGISGGGAGDEAGGVGGGGGGGEASSSKYGDLLAPLEPRQQVVLRFDHISSYVSAQLQPPSLAQRTAQAAAWLCGGGGGGRRGSNKQGQRSGGEAATSRPGPLGATPSLRQILFDVSGRVLPGQVLALMGPSGSGKTSLLSVLGGRAPSQVRVSGSVTVDGAPLSKAMRRKIGFVLQDDVLYETLTVHETLLYAGLLRLPRGMAAEEKRRRVEGVMAGLGLARSRDTIIGGFFRRGISGGERKRVSVGHELLINPAVLMLDEPTSGLDSTTALHLVQLLRQLAAGGRAIVTTIHQPSSRLYRQLDSLMLLAEGHVMYCGDANMAAEWFAHFGFGLPYGVSLADFILDCATGEVVASQAAADRAAAGLGSMGSLQAPAPASASASASEEDREREPSATGSATAWPGLAVAPNGRGGGGGGGRRAPAKVVEGLTGRAALLSLYGTFEAWYATHPGGFTDPSQLEGVQLLRRGPDGSARGGGGSGGSGGGGGAQIPTVQEDVVPGGPAAHEAAPGGVDVEADIEKGTTGAAAAAAPPPPGNGTAGGSGGVTPFGVAAAGKQPWDAKSPAAAAAAPPDSDGSSGGSGGGGSRNAAPYLEQVRILVTRAVKVRRFESLSGQNLVQMLAVSLITGLLWFQRGRGSNLAAGADVMGLLFFELLFPSFRSLFSSLFTFPNEYRMLKKERPAGMYRLSAYYAARTASDLPIELFYPTLFVVVIYWLGGLRPTPGAFFANLFSMLLIVLLAQSWGLLFGGTFMDPKAAQTITTVVMLSFLLVGGFYVKAVPVWIGWIKYLSFIYWGFNLLLKIQFRGYTYWEGGAPVTDIQSALGLPTDPSSSVAPDVLVLLGMLLLLRTLTYLVLRIKTEVKQPKHNTPPPA
ncbi:hypothetical protein PLESTF_001346200 [Pleodorina starrii]|nr:hypothetical protein PLESTF_001346200 [Pleodorina starrii]